MIATLTAGQWGLILLFFAGFVAARHHRRPRQLIRRVVRYRRRNFTADQRRELFARDDGRCRYCGVPVHYETDCPIGDCLTGYEADHYIPASKGGPTTVENGR